MVSLSNHDSVAPNPQQQRARTPWFDKLTMRSFESAASQPKRLSSPAPQPPVTLMVSLSNHEGVAEMLPVPSRTHRSLRATPDRASSASPSQSCAISASFLTRDQPLICRSRACPSISRS
jgi:hypothetical protein